MSKDPSQKNLIGPTDPSVDREARERLTLARVGMLLRHSFFGSLACRLELINADDWCPTAATDGNKFYYNSRFIMKLKTKEVEFLFGHEILHACYNHCGSDESRRGDRDPQLWNIACDYAVNADLKRHRVGQFITTVDCLYEYKYDGVPAEEIYDDLFENAEHIDMDDLLDQLLDEHLDGEGEGDGEEGEGQGKRPKMTKQERDQAKQELKEAMINAAQGAEPGSVPKGVERIIRDITDPVMPWDDLIQSQITSCVKSDYSLMRPSRRSWHMDAILPSQIPDPEVDVAIALDLSGSISDTFTREFISEVVGMTEQFGGFRIHLFCFDTEVYNPKVFTSDNGEVIEEYELMGGGGTDFKCIFNYLKEEAVVPERLIVFTDGYPWGSWGDENYCDTTWVIHGSTDIVAPFGQTVYYDDHKKLRAA